MSLFDAFSMFVGHIVLWGFGIFAGLFLGYFLLSVSIGVMAWIFNRFFEGESYCVLPPKRPPVTAQKGHSLPLKVNQQC